MLTRIDHVGIACHDLEEKIAFYETTFGLVVASREVNEAQGVKEAMLHVADGPSGASYVQLLEPLSADTPVGRFLAKRGEGVHHVGYGVDDVAAALDAKQLCRPAELADRNPVMAEAHHAGGIAGAAQREQHRRDAALAERIRHRERHDSAACDHADRRGNFWSR